MFKKLLRYEWTAMMRTMVPIYLAVIALTLISTFTFHGISWWDSPLMDEIPLLTITPMLMVILYVAVLVIMFVFSTVVTIQRFYKGLLKEEGYLMFTLPVKTWQLVVSKGLVSALMLIISGIVAFLSIGICIGSLDFITGMVELMEDFVIAYAKAVGVAPDETFHTTIFCLEILLTFLVDVFGNIYHLYCAMALGHLAGNHKVAFSVLAYVGINFVTSAMGMTLMQLCYYLPDDLLNITFSNGLFFLHGFGGAVLLYNLIYLAVMAGITHWILERKLNLE